MPGKDLTIINARITALDRSLPSPEAIAIRDGRFIAVGSEADVRAAVPEDGPSTIEADTRGDGESVFLMFASVPAQTHCAKGTLTSRTIDHRFAVTDASDEILLRSVAVGDRAAMHIIFARHRGRVLRVILRMVRNLSIAEDIANQVFIDVWRSANNFEYRARVSTWLVSIARFKAMNSLRHRVHESIDQDEVLGLADPGDTPELALGCKEVYGILRACLEELSPAHRQIIDLFYYRENSVAEVSQIIGIPQATAKSRLFYARKQLARILENVGFEAAAGRRSGRDRKIGSAVFYAGSTGTVVRHFIHVDPPQHSDSFGVKA